MSDKCQKCGADYSSLTILSMLVLLARLEAEK